MSFNIASFLHSRKKHTHTQNTTLAMIRARGDVPNEVLVGGSKHFLFLPLPGEMIQFDQYFSDGLKPPTRVWFLQPWSNEHHVGMLRRTSLAYGVPLRWANVSWAYGSLWPLPIRASSSLTWGWLRWRLTPLEVWQRVYPWKIRRQSQKERRETSSKHHFFRGRYIYIYIIYIYILNFGGVSKIYSSWEFKGAHPCNATPPPKK